MNPNALLHPMPRAAADTTLSLLWESVREKGDMPGFTRAISAILCAMRGEDDVEFNMTRTVLSDPVLTHKVLRLANSGMYAAFGQRVNTVSRAVLVLGTEAIGHLALGLKVIEEAAVPSHGAASAQAEMEKAVLAGMVARQLAGASVAMRPGAADGEQAVVCAMLHSLGRMMVTWYLPQHWAALQARGGEGQEDHFAPEVLGLALDDIGRAAARQWGLPATLVDSMRSQSPRAEGSGEHDWLALVATVATRSAHALWRDDPAALRALAAHYADALDLTPERILGAVEGARQAAVNGLAMTPLARARERQLPSLRADGARQLLCGVADMRDAAGCARPAQMVSMALETIYKGLGFTRAIAFLRSRRDGRYAASMGFGQGVERMLASLQFDDKSRADVFHASLHSDRITFIRHVQDPHFAARLPLWWRTALGQARSFVILPLCRNGDPVGFLYGDWLGDLPQPQLDQSEFDVLNDLRQLVVAQIDRRREPAAAGR